MAVENPIDQAHSSISRLSNLLFAVVTLGLLVGIAASSVVALLQQHAAWIAVILGFCFLITSGVLLRFLRRELSLRSFDRVLPTAIVFDPATDEIVLPVKLRIAPRTMFPPFPVQARLTHSRIKKSGELGAHQNRLYIDAMLTLLTALSDKLFPSDDFAPMIAEIDRGPFLSRRQYIDREHVSVLLEDCTPSIIDTGLVRKLYPSLSLNLPKGMSLRVHLSQAPLCSMVLSSSGISLSLRPAAAQGSSTSLSPWNRAFPKKPNDCQVMGLLFHQTLSFGGSSLLRINRNAEPPKWSFHDLLFWYYRVYEWFGTYFDWIESDDQIPEDELFLLIRETPPHYRHAKGAVPPGNGDIEYGMD